MRVIWAKTRGGIAILVPTVRDAMKGKVAYKVPLEYIPDNVREGEPLELTVLPDPTRREDLQKEVRELLRSFEKERPDLHGRADESQLTAFILFLIQSTGKQTPTGLLIGDVRKAADRIGKAIYTKLCSR